MAKGVCYRYFNNPGNTEMVQVISAFAIGVIFSPWNRALLLFITFLIVYEVIYLYTTSFNLPYWRLEGRVAIVMASIFGFIVGRTLVGFDDPIKDDRPQVVRALPPRRTQTQPPVLVEALRFHRLI